MIKLKKTVLDPETIPPVSIDFMNNTHFEEIAMVQDIGELASVYQEQEVHTDETTNKITLLLENWFEHTQAHFARENELMEKYQFPAYSVHADEHEIALAKLEAVIDAWKTDKDSNLLADYIFQLWPKWFSKHVNSMDLATAQFAMINGFNNE
ncbi:MAG: hemerythrin family protein [Thiotrichaceae bacterium]